MVSRWVVVSGGALALAVVAAGLAEATLALGHAGGLTDGSHVSGLFRNAPVASPITTPTPGVTPTPLVSPTPSPAATPASVTPTPVAAATAVTNAFVHLRAGASTSTAIIMDLNGGTAVELLPYSDSQWQQVRYGNQTGYIFKSYLDY